jgi:hypothetical protein
LLAGAWFEVKELTPQMGYMFSRKIPVIIFEQRSRHLS